MKISNYNRFIDLENGKRLAFNSMTCALAEIDESFDQMLAKVKNKETDNISDEEQELLDNMKLGGYIVSEDMDELKVVEYRNTSGKYSLDSLGLTIAPTLACNMACPYCYETPEAGLMDDKTQDHLINIVEKNAKRDNSIDITWYGGEPLVAKSVISKLGRKFTEISEKYNVPYSSYIVTNGYLIDDETIQMLKDIHVTGAQITIDGPPEIHNKRRILKNSDEPTFDVIVENVKKMIEEGFNTTIRINIDRSNVDHLDELIEIFNERGLKKASISLGQVTDYTEACISVSETCLDTEEYADVLLKYQKKLHNDGYDVVGYPYYPGIKANYCTADSSNGYVVDPKGYLYKCWNDIGNKDRSVGTAEALDLNQAISDKAYQRNIDYLLWSPFKFDDCKECDILPVCMGGCPYEGERNGHIPECEKWKYNIDEILLLTYEQQLESQEETVSN